MKLLKYGLPFAALALLASCSDDKMEGPAINPTPDVVGTAYAAFEIAMPSDAGTRAGDETYEDGPASEYAFKTGDVYIFEKGADDTSEDAYKFVKSGSISTVLWEDEDGQVTTSSKSAIAKFTNVTLSTSGKDYYALVVLNKPANFPEPSTTDTSKDTFGEWKILTDGVAIQNATNEFTMTNAPLLTDETVATLVKIEASRISTSPDNLLPAAHIYVQRIAAKVEFTNSTVNVSHTESDQVTFSGWGLLNTNKSSYPVQIVDNYTGSSKWFTSDPVYLLGAEFKSTFEENSAKNHQRIFWAEDPNYSDQEFTNVAAMNNVLNSKVAGTLGSPIYCMENTMEPKAMMTDQSTLFYLNATYWVDGYDDADDAVAPSFVAFAGLKVVLDEDFFEDNFYLTFKENPSKGISDIAITDLLIVDDTKVTADKIDEILSKIGETVTGDDQTTNPVLTDEQKAKLIYKAIGVQGPVNVNYYHNGVMYYTAAIRHFNGAPAPIADKSGNEKYDATHTGRFGLLRNNWYVLSVNSISGLGDPEDVPTPDPTDPDPDDPDKDQYIQCQIHILSWAKRSSSYDF